MNNNIMQKGDGFVGERMLNLPSKIIKAAVQKNCVLDQLYITNIGYFPKAAAHYRERKNGCEDNILIYCLHGKGYLVLGEERYEVNANQYILLPASSQYMCYWADEDEPWTIYWVHFCGNGLGVFNQSLNLNSFKGAKQIPFNHKALEVWDFIFESLKQDYSVDNLCNASFALYYFLSTFLFVDKHIYSAGKENDKLMKKAIDYMQSKLDQKLTVKEIADRLNLSSSHFSNIFKKSTGMSPIDYFIYLKMQKACLLLNSSKGRIKSIAFVLGYDDPFYFSRIFKKHMGISPEQYKETVKRRS
jgi:AraC-like DNA-binding protein